MTREDNLFDERKAAEMAAYILLKEKSGRMDYRKLIKLMYLSESKYIEVEGCPISYDTLVSETKGPVLSKTLELIKGKRRPQSYGWSNLINAADLENNTISVKEWVDPDKDFDLLCVAERKVIDDIWNRFGDMNEDQLSDYTHTNCSEWKKPKAKKPEPIDIIKLLENSELGKERYKEHLEYRRYNVNSGETIYASDGKFITR